MGGTWLAMVMLAGAVVEIAVLLALRRSALVIAVLPGLALGIALWVALAGGAAFWIGAALAAAGVLHAWDLRRRW